MPRDEEVAVVRGLCAASASLPDRDIGRGKSGLPNPRSITSRLLADGCPAFRSSIVAKTYGGRPVNSAELHAEVYDRRPDLPRRWVRRHSVHGGDQRVDVDGPAEDNPGGSGTRHELHGLGHDRSAPWGRSGPGDLEGPLARGPLCDQRGIGVPHVQRRPTAWASSTRPAGPPATQATMPSLISRRASRTISARRSTATEKGCRRPGSPPR